MANSPITARVIAGASNPSPLATMRTAAAISSGWCAAGPSQRALEPQRPGPHPRTARYVVADLYALLRVAGVPGPYVLAGHSNGGLFAQLYASTYPRQVAGLVLIDAVHPADHPRRLAMLEPLVPPEAWQALRQQAMAVDHRLIDPERVDIWTSERCGDLVLH